MLFRVFPMLEGVAPAADGGPLHVALTYQGWGRHDNPDRYGAFYGSRGQVSAVAERIQRWRGGRMSEAELEPEGRRLAVAALDDSGVGLILDLDDPRELVERTLRPSRVATGDREATRRIALGLFEEGIAGFEWWSAIEASWLNVTLFAERALSKLSLAEEPELLTLDHPAVVDAAEALAIRLEQ